jgi:segregation and condensation protein B
VTQTPDHEHPDDGKPISEQPVSEQPVSEQPANQQIRDERPADESPADERPADERPADERPADERPVGERPVGERQVDGEQPRQGEHAASGPLAASEEALSPSAERERTAVPAPRGERARQTLALATPEEVRPALEAILLVVDEPVADVVLAQILERPTEEISAVLESLAAEYRDAGRGFDLRRAAGGWRLYTRSEFAPYVERFVLDGQHARLTQAALETLAVVAYKQPVTRGRISAIRGVAVDGVIRTLLTRGLIEECGAEPDTGAHLYRTTTLFLEKLGLNGLDELPPLAPLLPDLDSLDDVITSS